jgi:hypothetical protein
MGTDLTDEMAGTNITAGTMGTELADFTAHTDLILR